MKLNDLKNIKNILITTSSEKLENQSKQFQLSLKKLVAYFLIYSLFVFLAGFIILNLTPLSQIFYSDKVVSEIESKEKLLDLSNKIRFLSNEIEELKSTNEKLKYAIMLGDSNFVKSSTDSDKTKEQTSSKKVEGNISLIFQYFFDRFFLNNQENKFFIRPLNGFISREFKPEEGHYGIDISVKAGSPIYASGNGYVAFSDYTVVDGYMIIIIHSNDYISIYKHCSLLLKNKRERIIQGEMIALSGNTGQKSHGSHLHFEVWKNGYPLNPLELFIN